MTGTDGQIHSTTLDASSLYDAADKATNGWARLWWFTSSAPVTVKHGEQTWTVSQEPDAGMADDSALKKICTLSRMHRCRPLPDLSPEHIRVIRHAITYDGDRPVGNSYVAGPEEFDLLEEMVRMGMMKFQRSVIGLRC